MTEAPKVDWYEDRPDLVTKPSWRSSRRSTHTRHSEPLTAVSGVPARRRLQHRPRPGGSPHGSMRRALRATKKGLSETVPP